jgi:hypothetical protein
MILFFPLYADQIITGNLEFLSMTNFGTYAHPSRCLRLSYESFLGQFLLLVRRYSIHLTPRTELIVDSIYSSRLDCKFTPYYNIHTLNQPILGYNRVLRSTVLRLENQGFDIESFIDYTCRFNCNFWVWYVTIDILFYWEILTKTSWGIYVVRPIDEYYVCIAD